MDNAPADDGNVREVVPFLRVTDMLESLRFYVDGLGFEMTRKWVVDGGVRWCWLTRGGAGLMLQDRRRDDGSTYDLPGEAGIGVSIVFICEDALSIHRELVLKGMPAATPFVGNGMWVTSVTDPDGFRLDFESYTDVPEGTEYSEG